MKQKSYKRQVARKAFDPIQAPDVSTRILQESENTVRGMQDVANAELRYREEFLNSQKDTQRLQKEFRESNFNLKTEFAEAYRDAELQHYKTRLNDVKTEEFENEQFNKLKTLIPKAFKNYVDFEEKRTERLKEIGAEIATRWGLTPQEAKAFKFAGQNIDWADAAINRVKQRLEKGGAGPEVLMQLTNLSGRKLLGAQELLLSNAGKNHYPQFLNENLHTKIPGLNMSLADMEGDEKGIHASDYRAAMRYWESRYIGKFKYGEEEGQGYDDAFIAKHLRPWMDKEHNLRMAAQNTRDTNAYKTLELERQTKNLGAKIFGDGGKTSGPGFLEWINSESGGDPTQRGRARRLGASILESMAGTGELNREQWNTIRNTSVKVGNKEVLLGDQWEDDFVGVEKALNDRATLVAEQNRLKRLSFNQLQQTRVLEASAEMGRRLNDAELNQIENQYLSEPGLDGNNLYEFNELPEWINTYRNTETLEVKVARDKLNDMVEKEQLTMASLYGSPWVPKELYKEFEAKARNNPSKGGEQRKSARQSVTNQIKSVANQLVRDDTTEHDVNLMIGKALDELTSNVTDALIDGKYSSANEAWTGEGIELTRKIEKGGGDYAVIRDGGGLLDYGATGGFVYVRDYKYEENKQNGYRLQADENKAFITLKAGTPGAISQDDYKSLKQLAIEGRTLPVWFMNITDRYPNKDPLEVLNTILTYNGDKPVEPTGGAKAYYYVHPTVRRIFSNKPSLAKTARAMSITTKLTNKDIDSFNPMLDLITSKEVIEADPQLKGFDAVLSANAGAMTTGSTLTNGTPLIEMTVKEIINNQTKQRVAAVGAYQINPGHLESLIERGFVSEDDLFDEETQRNLGALILWEKAGSFFSDASDTPYDPIPGLGQTWSSLKGEDKKFQEDERNVIANKLKKVKENLKAAGFDPLQFRDEINDTLFTLIKDQ